MTRPQPTGAATDATEGAGGVQVPGEASEARKTPPRRSRASAKKAGSSFERLIADHLAHVLEDDRIDRRVKTGNQDRGDIGGVRVHAQRIVIETKDYGGRLMPGQWIQEAQTEAGNDDALAGLVIAKRRGTTRPGSQYVLMTVDNLTALLTGQRQETE